MSELLTIKGLHKSFAVPVLKNLDFELRRGEIHALMGSNGAGKSTLCNIVCGIHQASSGTMLFQGQAHQPDSIKSAELAGIRMVMQELNLFPTLSIAENLCFKKLTDDSGWFGRHCGHINRSSLRKKAAQILEVLNLQELDPDTPIAELGVGQQQLVEIAAVISEPVKLLILDEPTAALTDPQIDELFTQLARLRDQGVGIIYISHRMDEIARIADRVSVLRDGELVSTLDAKDIHPDQIVSLMVGDLPTGPDLDTATEQAGRDRPGERKEAVLKIENLGRTEVFESINLDIHAGEILGIGGLIGSGRTELLRAIFGADRADSGGLRLATDQFGSLQRFASPAEAIAAGIGMVVEDRKDQGLLLSGSITANISLSMMADLHNQLGIMDQARELQLATGIAESLAIKHDHLSQPIGQLSGGNQQKALIGRWLLKDLPILLFDEPSRGVDARAKARIQQLIREQAAAGKAVIVVSSETQELFALSDRIAVMSNGRLAGTFEAENLSEEQLLEASFKFYSRVEQSTPGLTEPEKPG